MAFTERFSDFVSEVDSIICEAARLEIIVRIAGDNCFGRCNTKKPPGALASGGRACQRPIWLVIDCSR